ncbi:MAG: hypothetical protein U1F16_00220 [Turneriella sp.]
MPKSGVGVFSFVFSLLAWVLLFHLHAQENTNTAPPADDGSSVEVEPANAESPNAENLAADETIEDEKEEEELIVTEATYQRRVLLTIFINESKDKKLEYLGVSVADAFSTPLTKTGNFVILNRDSVERYMRAMSIPHDDIFSPENATRLGKAIGADVVLVGKFNTTGETVKIEARAIDVQTGLISVEDAEEIKTNASMFASIHRLVERMSGPMAEKMKPLESPPPPAEIVLDEKQIAEEVKKIEEKKAETKPPDAPAAAQERRLILDTGTSFLQTPGVSGKQIDYDGRYAFGALNPGFAAGITYQSSIPQWRFLAPLRRFDFAASLEYARYSAPYEVLSGSGQTLLDGETMRLQVFGAAFSLAHNFAVWKFTLTPYAGASLDDANFAASDGTTLFKGIIPGANLGCRWRIYEWRSFEIGLQWRSGFRYLNDGNSYFNHAITLSGGYRL